MPLTTHKRLLLFCIAVYLLATAFSVYCLTLKRDGLTLHTRDYPFYIEQAARLADPNLSNNFALNIEGYNFLGLQGTEGAYSIFQAIHTEYIRYSYTAFYFLFHSTTIIYLFYCLVFFAPILYSGLIVRQEASGGWKPVVWFVLLFTLFPATLFSATWDIRPRSLFISAWALAILAIHYQRPFREKLIAFLFLFTIREESILLGAILLTLNFLAMRGQPGRWRQTGVLLGLDLAVAAAFAAFMVWGGYTRTDPNFDPLNFLRSLSPLAWGLAGVGLAGLLAATFAIWRARPAWLDRWLMLLVYSAALMLTGLTSYRDVALKVASQPPDTPLTGWNLFLSTITSPNISLFFYIALLLLVFLWEQSRQAARAVFNYALAVLCLLFLAISIATIPGEVTTWSQAREPAQMVWDFKNSINRYQTHLLVDYDTYQAFYDVENTAVYQPLSLQNVDSWLRYYPTNKPVLAGMIRDQIEYVVISQVSLPNLKELVALAGVPATQVAANEKYVVLKIR